MNVILNPKQGEVNILNNGIGFRYLAYTYRRAAVENMSAVQTGGSRTENRKDKAFSVFRIKTNTKELDYLRATNPFFYAQAMRIQAMVMALEERLKTLYSISQAI